MKMSAHKVFWVALLLAGCPSTLAPPHAVIATGNSAQAEDEPATCEEPPSSLAVEVGKPAAIHGACSVDSNELALHFKWTIVDQPNGSAIGVVNDAVVSPTIVPDVAGRYRIGLVVSNGTLSSEQAIVTLEAL
jgi:hypothetical protein